MTTTQAKDPSFSISLQLLASVYPKCKKEKKKKNQQTKKTQSTTKAEQGEQ